MYKVYASLKEDLNEGWVWLQMANLSPRAVVRIENRNNRKTIYCEALQIDENYLKIYNHSPRVTITEPEHSIVINDWYRKLLGNIETKQEHNIRVSEANYLCGKLRSTQQHPQIVVRMASWLAILSVVLGVVSLCK
jgi:hypothetical protein